MGGRDKGRQGTKGGSQLTFGSLNFKVVEHANGKGWRRVNRTVHAKCVAEWKDCGGLGDSNQEKGCKGLPG